MSFETVDYETRGEVAIVRLNRPERMNAVTDQMVLDIIAGLDRADGDPAVRAVVVNGAGERAFCAGADLSGGGFVIDPEGFRDGAGQVSLRLLAMTKPVVGAINGVAVGMGASILPPMDARLCADHARFGFVFVRRGVAPEGCSTWFLPRLVGPAKALDWMLSGRVFDAEEALAGGLVQAVVPAADLLDRAVEKARELAQGAPVAISVTRQMIWRMLGAPDPLVAHDLESALFAQMCMAPDAEEGVRSFLDKRPPAFTADPVTDTPDALPWRPSQTR